MNKVIHICEPKEIDHESITYLAQNGYMSVERVEDGGEKEVVGIFVRTYTTVNSDLLDTYPNLRFVLRAGVGLDNIDLAECHKRNIAVYNAPGSNASTVSEYLLSMMIRMSRNFARQEEGLRGGVWRDMAIESSELTGKTVGLIGCGAVGKELAKKLQAFSVNVLAFDEYVAEQAMSPLNIHKASLNEVLSQSDILSIQIPLTTETRGMIGKDQLAMLKRTCILLNISRGEIVDEDELIDILKHHKIGGAVVDVFTTEPDINPEYLALDNVILTPHIAGLSQQATKAMSMGAVKNMLEATQHEK